MESEEKKNSHLFFLILALIVLGFIASLAFPINTPKHKLTDTSHFAGHFVPTTDNSRLETDTPATSSNS